ncbi:hypothetical protein [Pontiella agarivorans]|uniref:Uncharacterized protein n=1 Tax=Pontiella agarivorans TaxID=3038953 RepID=A0ABU5N1N4_9BACT|nr:hypothetical protein [Pontiella agarivorans]MDZ8120308.1 hypothetical protein [Pontiella agarivorans]
MTVFIAYLSQSDAATVWRDADHNANRALERIVRGTPETVGLREFYKGLIRWTSDNDGWSITDDKPNAGYTYNASAGTISDFNGNIFARNVEASTLSYANNRITLTLSVTSRQGRNSSTREYSTTIQPRNP